MPQVAQLSNDQLRTLLIGSAIRASQLCSIQGTFATGNQLIAQLPAVGVPRLVKVSTSLAVTVTGTGCTWSPKAPWNIYSQVTLRDSSGEIRVQCSCYILYLLSLLRRSDGYTPLSPGTDPPNLSATYPGSISNPWTPSVMPWSPGYEYFSGSRFNLPQSSGNCASGQVVFSFDIPIAYSELDLRGSSLLSTPGGFWTVTLDIAPALAALTGAGNSTNIDAPAVGASVPGTNNVTVNTGGTTTVQVVYYYYDPVQLPQLNSAGGVPLPLGDFAQVHELRGFKVLGSVLPPSGEYQWLLPTGRNYYRILESVNEQGTLKSSDVTLFRFLYKGATPALSEPLIPYLDRVRREQNRDEPNGVFYYDFSRRPWNSDSYGQLAVGTSFASGFVNTGNSYLEILSETIYQSNMIPV